MSKDYSKKDYERYIQVVKDTIEETERRMTRLDKWKEVAKMSYEEWLEFQNSQKLGWRNYEEDE